MPSGRSFALAFGTYTRLTGSGSQVRMLRCTRTASAILAGALSRISPRNGSSVGPSSAASSTSTSGPHRSPDQDRWPSYGTPQTEAELRSYLRERLAAYKLPRIFEFRSELPKNTLGKILKDQLVPAKAAESSGQ